MNKKFEYNIFIDKLTTKLHNFIASGYTLIDTTDTFIKKNYKGERIEYEFKIKMSELYSNPIFNLHYHIRRFFQHFQVPDIIVNTNYTASDNSTKIELQLSREEFIKFIPQKDDKGNSQSSREYLEKLASDIDLFNFVIEYEAVIKEFFEWLYSKLKDIHKNDIALVNEKTREIRKIWIPKSIAGIIQIYKLGRMNPDSIFAGSISPEKFKEISDSKLVNNKKLELFLSEIDDIELDERIIVELRNIFK